MQLSIEQALENAIAMLEAIAQGGTYNVLEYHDKVQSFRRALEEHREREMKARQAREAIRAAAAELRGQR